MAEAFGLNAPNLMPMKTTKTIEINVCDGCGCESYLNDAPRKCRLCKEEMCGGCVESFKFHVQRITPSPSKDRAGGVLMGHILGTVALEYNGTYCLECGRKVAKTMRELGFFASEGKPHDTTMD